MKILFLDESGDHNLSIIDPLYPLFVLGGIIVDLEYAEGELSDAVQGFKRRLFGRDDLILHTSDITRNRNGFERMKERDFRERFYREMNSLMSSLEYLVVACVIKKEEHLKQYGLAALDPYLLSLNMLVERFCFEIGDEKDGGIIVAEKRGGTLDRELELAWIDLKVRGTEHVKASKIEYRISSLNLRSKAENIPGLQLADLVVSPIGRHVLGKRVHEDYKIVESKYRRNRAGNHEGLGLVVLPK